MKLNKTALIATTVTAATVALAGCKLGGNSNGKTTCGAKKGCSAQMQQMTPATKTGCCAGKMQKTTPAATKPGCCAAKKMGCSAKTTHTTKPTTFASAAKQWSAATTASNTNTPAAMNESAQVKGCCAANTMQKTGCCAANTMRNGMDNGSRANPHATTTPPPSSAPATSAPCGAAQQ